MKYKIFTALLLNVMMISWQASATKRALIIAIGSYPQRSGWPKISSVKDVGYIEAALEKQGFDESNIMLIKDDQATKKGIENALDNLVASSAKGDVVVIHISSHGEQILDDNHDETDGLDECIVSYDAALPPRERGAKLDSAQVAKYSQNYFRDDEFGNYIDKLRDKVGAQGDVIVFMDNCHSGTGTRGLASVRGGMLPLVPDGFQPLAGKKNDNSIFMESGHTRGSESDKATYIVFSAAQADQLDYETQGDDGESMGSLTYAISKAFESIDNGITYNALFGKIQGIMAKKATQQQPSMEGTGGNRQIFGGNIVAQKPYIEIESIDKNGQQIKIKSGLLAGLSEGSKVKLYPNGTTDPAKSQNTVIAEGTVIKASNFTADVTLHKALTKVQQTPKPWVFVTEVKYSAAVIVRLQMPSRGASAGYTPDEAKRIEAALKDSNIQFSDKETPDLIIAKGKGAYNIIVAADGDTFNTVKSADMGDLKTKLNQYVQYKFLKNVPISDDNTIEVALVPVIKGKPDTNAIATRKVNGVYEFAAGDQLVLWVKNNGDKDVYINVLDMQPDGIINAILPKKKPNSGKPILPQDLKIKAHSDFLFKDYRISISPPYGNEVFKVFVSDEAIDMEGIATTREARGNFTVLEGIVQSSYSAGARGGGGVVNMSEADGSIIDVPFVIKKK